MVFFCFLKRQLHVITKRDYSCVFAFAVYRDYRMIHHFRTCVGKRASDSSFLTNHVDFSVFFFWFMLKEPLYCSVTKSVSRCEPTYVLFQPARRSPFSHSLQKAAPLIDLNMAFHAALNPGLSSF